MARRMLVGIAMALALASVSAETAAATGTYTVWSCRGPQGELVSSAAWRAAGTAGTRADTCGAAGALSAALGATDNGADDVSGFRFPLPPGVTVSTARIWMSARMTYTGVDGYGYAAGPAIDRGVSVGPVVGGCPRAPTFGCTFGNELDRLGAGNLVTVAGPADGLAFVARCTQSASCFPQEATSPPVSASLYRSAVELADPAPPVAEAPVVREATAGRTALDAGAGDVGGGIAQTTLVIDGQPFATQAGTGDCQEPYAAAAPCPAKGHWIFDVSSKALAPGAHDALVRVTDAAGNVTDSGTTTFVLAPAPDQPPIDPPIEPPVDPPVNPPAGPLPVNVRLASTSARIALPSKGPIVGSVKRTDGTPVAGLKLTLREAGLDANGRRWKDAGSVTTGADGTFRIAAGSVSRMLRLTPAGAEVSADPIDLTLVRPLSVKLAKPRARVRNGARITLRGRLAGAGADARRRTTVVQAMVDGRWQDVASTQPTTNGTVTWRYRFRHTTEAAIYRFRLKVPAQAGLPWKTVTSSRVSVRVDP